MTSPTQTVRGTFSPAKKMNLLGLVFGAMFGGVLAASNLHEYDTIHKMLALEELDVFWFMGSAIAVSAPTLWFLEKRKLNTPLGGALELSRSKPEKHHLKGGAMFGAGWAIAGTCPAPALVMVSSGAWLGLVAIAGIFLGLYLKDAKSKSVQHVGDGEHRELVTAGS